MLMVKKLSVVRRANNKIAQDSGRMAEKVFFSIQRASGNTVKRTGGAGKGDFDVWDRTTGKKTSVEVKSGKAKLSKLQKKNKKLKVVRFGW